MIQSPCSATILRCHVSWSHLMSHLCPVLVQFILFTVSLTHEMSRSMFLRHWSQVLICDTTDQYFCSSRYQVVPYTAVVHTDAGGGRTQPSHYCQVVENICKNNQNTQVVLLWQVLLLITQNNQFYSIQMLIDTESWS